jgi:hypothetical protein
MSGQEQQMQAFWDHQARTLVSACLIEHQDNMFVWPDACLFSKSCQSEREHLNGDGRHQQPARLTALWSHETIQIHPLIPLPHDGLDTASFLRPDPAQDGFEANAVLITAPQFHRCAGMSLTNPFDLVGQFF